MKLTVFTDGASRGNPGPAAYGFVVYDGGKVVYKEGKTLGVTTNNVAEYTSVRQALKYLQKNYPDKLPLTVDFYADSKLVVEQLSGRFKVKSAHLKEIINEINRLILQIGKATFKHIPREKNSAADKLANIALDQR